MVEFVALEGLQDPVVRLLLLPRRGPGVEFLCVRLRLAMLRSATFYTLILCYTVGYTCVMLKFLCSNFCDFGHFEGRCNFVRIAGSSVQSVGTFPMASHLRHGLAVSRSYMKLSRGYSNM